MLDASCDVHVRLPRRLYESINSLVVKKGYYRSAPEFVLECTRQKIDEIKKNRID
jgi:Arc/MetJ-type ribon-helix-helix transcriptional regulator